MNSDYIAGRCIRTGLVKFWPKTNYYIKDTHVYMKGSKRPLGTHDESLLTPDAIEHLKIFAKAEKARKRKNTPLTEEQEMKILEEMEKEMIDDEHPKAPESVSEQEAMAEITQQNNAPAQQEEAMQQEQINPENTAKQESVKEKMNQSTTSKKEETMKTTQATKKTPKMTVWGVTWRLGLLVLLLAAVTAAVIMGAQYALAYIAGIEGLGATSAMLLKYAVYGCTALAAHTCIYKSGQAAFDIVNTFSKSKFDKELAAAEQAFAV